MGTNYDHLGTNCVLLGTIWNYFQDALINLTLHDHVCNTALSHVCPWIRSSVVAWRFLAFPLWRGSSTNPSSGCPKVVWCGEIYNCCGGNLNYHGGNLDYSTCHNKPRRVKSGNLLRGVDSSFLEGRPGGWDFDVAQGLLSSGWFKWNWIALLRSSRLPQALLFWKNAVPDISWYIIALLRSSRLPQAFFFQQKCRSWDLLIYDNFVEVFPAAAGAFLSAKMAFLRFFDI